MSNSSARTSEAISSAILGGRWRPGERLQPQRLATELEVSTTVVREALSRMVGDGLVVLRPNRGFFIPQLDLRELRDLTELRCVSEGLALKLAIERGDLDWESSVIAAHHALARTPRHRDPAHPDPEGSEAWSRAHRAFHRALLAACQCEAMLTLSDNLAASTALYRRWSAESKAGSARNVEQEHQALMEAVVARDAARAERLLRKHYEATVAVLAESDLAGASE